MATTFVATGLACLIAAVIGGGLKAFGIEIPILQSGSRQLGLGVLGAVLVSIGLAMNSGIVPKLPSGLSQLDRYYGCGG